MEVRVKFYGNYRRLLPTPEVRLEVGDGATPVDVVRSLGEQYGEKVRAALLAEKDGRTHLQAGIRIAVGEEIIDCTSDLQRPLTSTVQNSHRPIEVFIFPPLMGGR
jgi:molybdopterin converting factor small subunit